MLETPSARLAATVGGKHGEIVPRYTFEVALEANKPQIRQAVEALFGVKVVKVNTMRLPGKARTLRTRKGIYRKRCAPVEESDRDAGRRPDHRRVAGVSRAGEDTTCRIRRISRRLRDVA